eukprot:8891177-Pyramimonas_sp.AAC.1
MLETRWAIVGVLGVSQDLLGSHLGTSAGRLAGQAQRDRGCVEVCDLRAFRLMFTARKFNHHVTILRSAKTCLDMNW